MRRVGHNDLVRGLRNKDGCPMKDVGHDGGGGMWIFLDQALCNLGTDPCPGAQDDTRGDPCQRLAGMT